MNRSDQLTKIENAKRAYMTACDELDNCPIDGAFYLSDVADKAREVYRLKMEWDTLRGEFQQAFPEAQD